MAPPEHEHKEKWPRLRSFLTFCTYLYLLRFSVLTAVVMFVLLLFAISGGAKMLAGAFDQWMRRQIVALVLTDCILSWTLLVMGHLVIDYAEQRGSAPALLHKARWRGIWTGFCLVVAIPMLVVAYIYS